MKQKYCTLRLRIAGRERISFEFRDWNNKQKEYTGNLGYKKQDRSRIEKLHQAARKGELTGPDIKDLGKRLFSVLFAHNLRREFLEIYRSVKNESALLRLELDVDEVGYPEIASLPWEFMYAPSEADGGGIWLAAAPHLVFSRRRVEGEVPEPCRLEKGERLRIALAVSAPESLGKVQYNAVYDELTKLSLSEGFEFLDIVLPANQQDIYQILEEKKPHIFHFIGHGEIIEENGKETGRLALTDITGGVDWVSADDFSELFHRHSPGLVVLQSCESGALSSSQALVGIASKMVQKDIPAVAAMQFAVSNVTAKRFAQEFYRRLAKYEPVDKAVQEARLKIGLRHGHSSRDFATPVLFMQIKEERLFQRHPDDILQTKKDYQSNEKINIKELLGKLAERLNLGDIDVDLFFNVTTLLNKIGSKKPDDEGKKYTGLIREFISKTITTAEFKKKWQEYRESSHLEHVEKGPGCEILADRLNRGKIIPFLGSDVLQLSGFPVPSSPAIVKKMAQKVDCPEFTGTLSMLFQYCESEKKWDRGRIIKKFREVMMEERQAGLTNSLYDLLAEIKAAVLVISSSYDDLLEAAFREKGKKFLVLSHFFKTTSDIKNGRILLQYDYKSEPEEHCLAKDLPDLEEETKKGYSIIYKICGYFNFGEQRSPQGTREAPMMLLENDFFAFSRKLEHLVPLYITAKCSELGFLFLGYNLHEWQDRLIADTMLEYCPKKVDSFTVCENLNPYEWAFWKSTHKLVTYREELNEFVHQLCRQIKCES